MVPMIDYTSAELLVILGTVILLVFLLTEIYDGTTEFFAYETLLLDYTYNKIGGPVTWKQVFPQSNGERQSPLNIDSEHAIVVPVETLPPLTFSAEYHLPPRDFRLYNDGHCVTLFASWPEDAWPLISGGPLQDCYQFVNARFRWGPTDEEGSEHTTDSHRYAMELQAAHIKRGRTWKLDAEDNNIIIVSYFFQVVSADNPSLEPITSALKKIPCPYTCVNLEPAPLSFLMPPFSSKYYTYCGSLTFPPCHEGVQWIIQSEPLGISSRQIRKFRKLCAIDGPMDLNTRPVQDVNGREIFFYD